MECPPLRGRCAGTAHVGVGQEKTENAPKCAPSRYLTEANVGDLVHAATHKSKEQVAQLIADRFPRRDLPERLEAIAPAPAMPSLPVPQSVQHSSKKQSRPSPKPVKFETARGLRTALFHPSGSVGHR